MYSLLTFTPSIDDQITDPQIDFEDSNGGTFTGIAGISYTQENPSKPMVLFVSKQVPGANLVYYPDEKKLEAGTPKMIVDNIELFQGEKHVIKYSVKNPGNQSIMIDGKLIQESHFIQANKITGFLVYSSVDNFDTFTSVTIE